MLSTRVWTALRTVKHRLQPHWSVGGVVTPPAQLIAFSQSASIMLVAAAAARHVRALTGRSELRLAFVGDQLPILSASEAFFDVGLCSSPDSFFEGDPALKCYPYRPLSEFQAADFDVVFVGDRIPETEARLREDCRRRCAGAAGPVVIELQRLARAYQRVCCERTEPLRTCLNQHKLAALAVAAYLAPHDGCIAECGVASGGTTVFLATLQKLLGIERPLFALDTFQGMPEPVAKDYGGGFVYTSDFFRDITIQRVADYYRSNGVEDDVRIIPGLVQETLPQVFAECPRLALMLLDTDQYSGTKGGLDCGLPRLCRGGMIIVDDTTVHGVNTALEEGLRSEPRLQRRSLSHNFDLLHLMS